MVKQKLVENPTYFFKKKYCKFKDKFPRLYCLHLAKKKVFVHLILAKLSSI